MDRRFISGLLAFGMAYGVMGAAVAVVLRTAGVPYPWWEAGGAIMAAPIAVWLGRRFGHLTVVGVVLCTVLMVLDLRFSTAFVFASVATESSCGVLDWVVAMPSFLGPTDVVTSMVEVAAPVVFLAGFSWVRGG